MAQAIIPILGAGESGIGAARLALRHGLSPWVSDRGTIASERIEELNELNIAFESGQHDEPRILEAGKASGFVIKSPGIPEHAALIITLRQAGVEVISEIEFAARYARTEQQQIIAITGANGKTTTTAMISAILSDAGCDVACVGNIGTSWSRDLANREHPAGYQVVEVSSFQLDGTVSFRPDIAILLNITPDHLDRYNDNIEDYADSKWRITAQQTEEDVLILNADDALSMERWKRGNSNGTRARVIAISVNESPEALKNALEKDGLAPWGWAGVSIDANTEKETFTIYIPTQNPFTMTIQELALQGKHNLYNSMAASVATRVLELRSEGIRESLSQFDAIEHRMEFVQEINNIKFVNDSKATNVNSAWFALESIEGPIIWIAGGVDKGNDYASLMHLVTSKVDHMICLGKNNQTLLDTFGDRVESTCEVETAQEAVQAAYDLGMPGCTVLLSPACASFDLFGSYEERGREFKAAVRSL
ncbi:UDP-N-acetylmuramoyl-L-alanine--D-glutamate ligase [Flavobacteriales bacterium]|nr:UDP-N-acetylmuramoyl-L-alanine--D-glutamate ligase [Flavobacteriales bacterium]